MFVKHHIKLPDSLNNLLNDHTMIRIHGRDGTTLYYVRMDVPEYLRNDAKRFLTGFDNGSAIVFTDPDSKKVLYGRGYTQGNFRPYNVNDEVWYEIEFTLLVRDRRNIVLWVLGVFAAMIIVNLPAWIELVLNPLLKNWPVAIFLITIWMAAVALVVLVVYEVLDVYKAWSIKRTLRDTKK